MKKTNTVQKRILTGDRPTGSLHLGHYVGSLQQRVRLQDEYEQYILVADTQALTDNFDDPQKVQRNVVEVTMDNLAVGVDPQKSTLYIQSQISAVAELFVIFSNLVSVEEVGRNPTVKAEILERSTQKKTFNKRIPFGFFSYPLHQCADILCVNGDLVPVGEDQLPMVELSRTVAKRFNEAYSTNLFHIPEAKVTEVARLVGTDGNAKMSKSLGNCIYLSDDEETLRKKVFSVYTDPKRIHANDPGQVEGNVVFIYLDAFDLDTDEVTDLKKRYREGRVGDVEVKERLFQVLNTFLTPIRDKRKYYESRKEEVMEILMAGSEKVRKISNEILLQAKEAMKIRY